MSSAEISSLSEGSSSSVQMMQRLRMKRFGLLCVALLTHLALCVIALTLGDWQVSAGEVTTLIVLIVAGLLGFLALIYFEHNLAFADPDLALEQMVWAMAIVIGSALLTSEMRPLLLVAGTGLLLAGTHRLDRRKLLWFAVLAAVLYGLASAMAYLSGRALPGMPEILICSVVLFAAPVLIRFEKNIMQNELLDRNHQLSKALERISALAIRDELTGAFNQRHLADVLHHQKAMADRRNYTFSICFVDLDYFKRVNSLFGRHTGDLVLKDFVRIAESVVREVDCVARVSGEEFVLVLGGATEQDAWVVAQRLRTLLQDLKVSSCAPDYRLSASIGISQYRSEENFEVTLKRSAACLYQARVGGRDRIIVADAALEASIAG